MRRRLLRWRWCNRHKKKAPTFHAGGQSPATRVSNSRARGMCVVCSHLMYCRPKARNTTWWRSPGYRSEPVAFDSTLIIRSLGDKITHGVIDNTPPRTSFGAGFLSTNGQGANHFLRAMTRFTENVWIVEFFSKKPPFRVCAPPPPSPALEKQGWETSPLGVSYISPA